MSVILGLFWMIMGIVFMVKGMDFDMIFKAFLLTGVFFVSISVSAIKTELKNNIRIIVRDENDLTKKGEFKHVDKT